MGRFRYSLMKENELGMFGRIAIVVFLIMPTSAVALVNIVGGGVRSPVAFLVVIVGCILFILAKLSVVLRKKWISFGSGLMSDSMANVYRVGCWLMVVGTLLTFA